MIARFEGNLIAVVLSVVNIAVGFIRAGTQRKHNRCGYKYAYESEVFFHNLSSDINPLNVNSFSALFINIEYAAAQHTLTAVIFKARRHTRFKFCDDILRRNTEHTLHRADHTEIGYIARTVWQNSLVRRRHVGMSTENNIDFSRGMVYNVLLKI